MRKRDHNSRPTPHRCSSAACWPVWWSRRRPSPRSRCPAWPRRPAPRHSGNLPTELTVTRAPQISYIYASDGKTLLATMYDENRRDVPLADISPVMQQGHHRRRGPRLLQAQRRRHQGRRPRVRQQPERRRRPAGRLDADHAVRPAGHRLLGDPPGRTSSPRPRTPAPARSARCSCALQVEKEFTKDEILERYLNIAAVRQRRVRHLRRQPGLLQQGAQGPDARARRRCWPAWSRRRPRTTRPPTSGLPARAATGATTSSTTWSRSAHHPGARRTPPRRPSWS